MEALKELRAEDWEIRYRGNRFAFLGNGLSQAEFDPSCDLAYYVRDRDESPWASRRKRRKVLTRSGTQMDRELHVTCRRDPDDIVLESKSGDASAVDRTNGFRGTGLWDGRIDGRCDVGTANGLWNGGVNGLWDGKVR